MCPRNFYQCRAISLAIFGSPDNVEFVVVFSQDRFTWLRDGKFDVMATTTTHTMGRDVHEATSYSDSTFSVPFFYTGLVFSGLPDFVDCADNLDSLYGHCRNTRACVIKGTTHEDLLREFLPGAIVVPADSLNGMVEDFVAGKCDIIASELPNVPEKRFRDAGFTGTGMQCFWYWLSAMLGHEG